MLSERYLRRLLRKEGYQLVKLRGQDLYRIRNKHSGKYSETLRGQDVSGMVKLLVGW